MCFCRKLCMHSCKMFIIINCWCRIITSNDIYDWFNWFILILIKISSIWNYGINTTKSDMFKLIYNIFIFCCIITICINTICINISNNTSIKFNKWIIFSISKIFIYITIIDLTRKWINIITCWSNSISKIIKWINICK